MDTSACVNASAVASAPNTHEPMSVSTASRVTIISVPWPRNSDETPGVRMGRNRKAQMYKPPTSSAAA
jgi:hypothetical protein